MPLGETGETGKITQGKYIDRNERRNSGPCRAKKKDQEKASREGNGKTKGNCGMKAKKGK